MKNYIYFLYALLSYIEPLKAYEEIFPPDIRDNIIFQELKSHPPTTQQISISHFPVEETESFIISSFIHQRNRLSHFSLVNSNLSDSTSRLILGSLYQHPELKSLNLSLNMLGKETALHLGNLIDTISSIKHLDLHLNSFIDDSLVRTLSNLEHYNKIQYLDLSHNSLSPGVIDALANLAKNCTSLHHLKADFIALPHRKRINFLADLAKSQSLMSLSLNYNDLSGCGIEIGQLIKSCPTLTTLNLTHCYIKENDILNIIRQTHFSKTQAPKPLFSSAKQPEPRFITITLEKSQENQLIAQYYQQHKPHNSGIEILFQIGLPWE